MIRRYRHIVLLTFLLLGALINESHAQSRYDSAYIEIARKYKENLLVFTDRNLYAVNESICFSAFLQYGEIPYRGLGSSVLYLELVNSSGNAVAKGKYSISENRSIGQLSIPSTLLSGIYYLRSYTRWMRNFGSQDYTYIPICVVNPYSGDVVEDKVLPGKKELSADSSSTRIVSVSSSRPDYHRGDLVEVELSLEEGSISHVPQGCISVVPAGSVDTTGFMYRVDAKLDGKAPFQFDYLPEIEGTSISGIVLETYSQKPVAEVRIHFSILGDEPAYFVTQSDQQGTFAINTPWRSGNMEMFVVPENQSDHPIEVRIDNDFTSEPLPFQPGTFKLSQEEQVLASRMSLNMQLQGTFLADSVISDSILTEGSGSSPFYGTPEITVNVDEFVNLPNLEEVIENLVPNTYVLRREGSRSFLIKSDNPMISMFPPLILIDHIPVFDMEVIMAIPPSKIDHIEVIPEVYVLGEIKYGGIISISSRQGDLASIKLPEGSYFFDYMTYQAPRIPKAARYSGPGKIPDTRNTLFWMDQVELHGDRSLKVSFPAATVPGTYDIIFRGVSSEGEFVLGLNQFTVE